MYSVVMLVALSTSGEMADLGHKKGGCGCSAPAPMACSAPVASCAPVSAGCGHARGHMHKSHGHSAGCSTGCASAPACGAPVYSGGCSAPAARTCSTGTCGSSMGYAAAPMYGNPGMGYASAPVSSGCSSCNSVSCAPMTTGNEAVVLAPATIVVDLPADAKLVINEIATTSTSATRTFISPELNSAKEYTYTLRAEVVREGKTVVMEKLVDVRGGQTFAVSFNEAREVVAAR